MLRIVILLIFLILPFKNSLATNYSVDAGKIELLSVNSTGHLRLLIKGGFVNAVKAFPNCAKPGHLAVVSPEFRNLIAAIIAAKSTNSTIRVVVTGCESAQFKITEIYIL